jgi:hypothetical protein
MADKDESKPAEKPKNDRRVRSAGRGWSLMMPTRCSWWSRRRSRRCGRLSRSVLVRGSGSTGGPVKRLSRPCRQW